MKIYLSVAIKSNVKFSTKTIDGFFRQEYAHIAPSETVRMVCARASRIDALVMWQKTFEQTPRTGNRSRSNHDITRVMQCICPNRVKRYRTHTNRMALW